MCQIETHSITEVLFGYQQFHKCICLRFSLSHAKPRRSPRRERDIENNPLSIRHLLDIPSFRMMIRMQFEAESAIFEIRM